MIDVEQINRHLDSDEDAEVRIHTLGSITVLTHGDRLTESGGVVTVEGEDGTLRFEADGVRHVTYQPEET